MKLQKKSIVAMLLLMLAFNLTATVLSVQALDPGTGKYLTIVITGDGYVIATKEKSGETWRFDPPNATYKVGAGTVLLEPFAAEGYRFVEWIGDVNPDDTYKTEKYGVVTAVFEELTYTITASADPEGFIIPNGTVIVTRGDNFTFWFGPTNPDYHVSTIVVDGNSTSGFLETYTFENVTANHTIHVALDLIGTVSVPAGPGGSFNVDPFVQLTLGNNTGGVIFGSSVIDLVLPGTAIRLYNITWGTVEVPGGVVLVFLIPEGFDPYNVTIVHGDSIEAILSDVNRDFQVDGTDVSIVANAIKFKIYDPLLDTNGDGNLTQLDIHIINENKRATLKDVTGPVVGEPPGPYFVTTIPLQENKLFFVR